MSGVVIVTGGRYYSDRMHVYRVLDRLHAEEPIDIVVHGACPFGGADLFAEEWARHREVSYLGLPAKFKAYGGRAGPYRNEDMVRNHAYGGRLVAFPGGNGTNGTVEIAEHLNEDEGYSITIIDERGEAA